jgi:transcriptional regulator with XRE-family HTH domain
LTTIVGIPHIANDPWQESPIMIVRTTREIGLLVRDRRQATGLTQAQLAEQAGSSREWVRLLESGRPRLDLGLTLRALSAVGIVLDAQVATSTPPASRVRPRPARRAE